KFRAAVGHACLNPTTLKRRCRTNPVPSRSNPAMRGSNPFPWGKSAVVPTNCMVTAVGDCELSVQGEPPTAALGAQLLANALFDSALRSSSDGPAPSGVVGHGGASS